METMATPPCSLCASASTELQFDGADRSYYRCQVCDLLLVASEDRPDSRAEKAHYHTHENDPTDNAYRQFLDRLLEPLQEKLSPGAAGLDFGSGPGPTASIMLADRGFPTAIYDPFFAPDPAPLQRTYDFVTCSETVEHFHSPADDFQRLHAVLKPTGWLGVMTEMVDDRLAADWWYLRDPTHVCFYSMVTMQWIAQNFGWQLESPRNNVVLFRKA
jgi:SAM-dependent methyltransferase